MRADHLDRAGSYAGVPCQPAEPDGYHRANDIRRGIPLISRTLLAQRLKELERVGIDPAAFPDGRTTVQFEFTDAAEGKKLWWLVNAGGTVDLCPFDPGFPVDLYVTTDLDALPFVLPTRQGHRNRC